MPENDGMIFRDSQEAFQNAIDRKVLSENQGWENFAGKFMYMHSDDEKDWFKHCDTRHYVGAIYRTETTESEELVLTNPAPAAAPRARAQQASLFDDFDGKYTGPPVTGEAVELCEMCPDRKTCQLRRAGARGCGVLAR